MLQQEAGDAICQLIAASERTQAEGSINVASVSSVAIFFNIKKKKNPERVSNDVYVLQMNFIN